MNTISWSTPRTWTSGEIVTASVMNTHVRDQFNYLGTTHKHGGAAGDGNNDLGPVETVSFADATADPGTGTLQVNGTALKYHNGTVVVVLSENAAAGTPSLRSLGTDGTQAAAGNHTHTITYSQNASATARNVGNTDIGPTSTGTLTGTSIVTTTAARIAALGQTVYVGGTGSGTLQIRVNGTLVGTADASVINENFVVAASHSVGSSGTYAVTLSYSNVSTDGTNTMSFSGVSAAAIRGTI